MKLSKTFNKTIAKRLKKLRKEEGLSEIKAAEKIGITRQTLANYENETIPQKQPTISVVGQIADYYGVSIDYLSGRINQKIYDNKYLCEETGLSESAVEYIKMLPALEKSILNKMLSSESGLSDMLKTFFAAEYESVSSVDLEGEDGEGVKNKDLINAVKIINNNETETDQAVDLIEHAKLFRLECRENLRVIFQKMIDRLLSPVIPPEIEEEHIWGFGMDSVMDKYVSVSANQLWKEVDENKLKYHRLKDKSPEKANSFAKSILRKYYTDVDKHEGNTQKMIDGLFS